MRVFDLHVDRRPDPREGQSANARGIFHPPQENERDDRPDDENDRVAEDEERHHDGQAHDLRDDQ